MLGEGGSGVADALILIGALLQAAGFLLTFLDLRGLRRAMAKDRTRTQIVEVGSAIDLSLEMGPETVDQRLDRMERRLMLLFETAASKSEAVERRLVREVDSLRLVLGPSVGPLWRRTVALAVFLLGLLLISWGSIL